MNGREMVQYSTKNQPHPKSDAASWRGSLVRVNIDWNQIAIILEAGNLLRV